MSLLNKYNVYHAAMKRSNTPIRPDFYHINQRYQPLEHQMAAYPRWPEPQKQQKT